MKIGPHSNEAWGVKTQGMVVLIAAVLAATAMGKEMVAIVAMTVRTSRSPGFVLMQLFLCLGLSTVILAGLAVIVIAITKLGIVGVSNIQITKLNTGLLACVCVSVCVSVSVCL
jgi:hypothetical protein